MGVLHEKTHFLQTIPPFSRKKGRENRKWRKKATPNDGGLGAPPLGTIKTTLCGAAARVLCPQRQNALCPLGTAAAITVGAHFLCAASRSHTIPVPGSPFPLFLYVPPNNSCFAVCVCDGKDDGGGHPPAAKWPHFSTHSPHCCFCATLPWCHFLCVAAQKQVAQPFTLWVLLQGRMSV